MYQLKLFKALVSPKKAELETIDFELGRKLASKALLYIIGKANKNDLDFARKAYIVISKL